MKPSFLYQNNYQSTKMTTLKPFKFTICYRKTVYVFTTSKFTEDDLDVVDNESLVADVDGKYDETDVINRKIYK